MPGDHTLPLRREWSVAKIRKHKMQLRPVPVVWIDYCSLITRELSLPKNISVQYVLEAIFSTSFSHINNMTCYDWYKSGVIGK